MQPEPQTLAELVDAAHQRGGQAAKRAIEAHQRAQQLEEGRLAATGTGQPTMMSDAGTAQRATKLAEQSRTRAAAAHLDAATAHGLAARAYELAAETDPGHADEHRRQAQRHHAEAEEARHHAGQEQQS